MGPSEYVAIDEAARYSGLHPVSIRRLLRQGAVLGYKTRVRGRWRWLVNMRSLREYITVTLTFASDRPGPKMYLRCWKDE